MNPLGTNSSTACERCRRDIIKIGWGLGVQLALLPALRAEESGPRAGDLLIKTSDATARPLTPADIRAGGRQTMAWAMDPADKTIRSGSRLNRILLVRSDVSKLTADTRARSAEGVVAYSAICPHAGCEVTEWIAEQQRLFCPCHESTFDPADGAKVIDGPATRGLPSLALGLSYGRLVITQAFSAPITFETQ